MDGIVGVFTSLPSAKSKNDDDFSDRLSSRYTVILLVVFALIVVGSQYVGSPITCWAPVHFTGNHIKYANAYCWVRNTYYLPFYEEIPKENEPEKRQVIPYYQWIPFILLAQAILFYFPSVIWHGFNQQGGVDADNLLAAAATFNRTDKVEAREGTLMLIRNQMDRFLISRKSMRKAQFKHAMMKRDVFGRRFGAFMITLYIFVKVLYLANIIVQLFLLNSVLATEYSVYGIEVMKYMADDYDWTGTADVAFPRVTMCDFKVRRLGNIHRYTVQCNLPINMYNEKIYMFLWFWMLMLAVVTCLSLITWILRMVSSRDRLRYIENHLRLMDKLDKDREPDDRKTSDAFVRKYLKQDGVFLLRLIGHNTNTVTVSEIIGALWDNWPGPRVPKARPEEGRPEELTPTLEKPPMNR